MVAKGSGACSFERSPPPDGFLAGFPDGVAAMDVTPVLNGPPDGFPQGRFG